MQELQSVSGFSSDAMGDELLQHLDCQMVYVFLQFQILKVATQLPDLVGREPRSSRFASEQEHDSTFAAFASPSPI
jgi:hypothetical protein